MQISKGLIQAFQETYEQKFGQVIPAREAESNLSDLAELIKLIAHERSENGKQF